MLVQPRELLMAAQIGGYAIGAFNTYNLEFTLGILRAAELQRSPVILQVGASALSYGGEASLSALALSAAKAADVPVVVHLDHAFDLKLIESCIKRGFTSVMFDGSTKSFDENVELTRKAVALAHAAGISIEAELGAVGGREDGAPAHPHSQPFTDPDQAAEFMEATGADVLAVAIGNVHGFYEGEPQLDFERLSAIHQRVEVPLVLHGASGIPDMHIKRAIQGGICKINVNTELRRAFFQTLKTELAKADRNYNLPRLMNPAIDAVQAVASRKIAVFGSTNRA